MNKSFAIILGIQMVGALLIAGVLVSDRLTELATLMFLLVCMALITIITMSVIAYMLKVKNKRSLKDEEQESKLLH